MSIFEKLLLGVNTTVIGMGIVFLVLIILSIIVAIQSKLVAVFFKGLSSGKEQAEIAPVQAVSIPKSGTTNGETELNGIDDEETVAVIMATVSRDANIPLHELKIKSIKAV